MNLINNKIVKDKPKITIWALSVNHKVSLLMRVYFCHFDMTEKRKVIGDKPKITIGALLIKFFVIWLWQERRKIIWYTGFHRLSENRNCFNLRCAYYWFIHRNNNLKKYMLWWKWILYNNHIFWMKNIFFCLKYSILENQNLIFNVVQPNI